MSETYRCRLCENVCNGYKSLYDANGCYNKIYAVTTCYFHPTVLSIEQDKNQAVICLECWQLIEEFHNFRQSVLQKQLKVTGKNIDIINISDLGCTAKIGCSIAAPNCYDNSTVKIKFDYISTTDSGFINVPEISNEIRIEGKHDNTIVHPGQVTCSSNNGRQVETLEISDDSENEDYDTEMSEEFDDPVGSFTYESCNGTNEETAKYASNNEETRKPVIIMETCEKTDATEPKDDNLLTVLNISSCSTLTKNVERTTQNIRSEQSKLKRKANKRRTNDVSDKLIAQWLPILECAVCHNCYSTFTHLKEHFRQEHRNNEFYVVCCERKFSYRCHVEEHIRLHLDPNTFKCELCGKRFSSNANLCSHRHEKCSPLDIGKQRKSFQDLDEVIAKWKPFLKCIICGESFPHFTLLKQHFRRSHRNEEFYVLCCERKFFYRHQLEEHIRLHLDPDYFKCDLCGKRCSSRVALNTHMSLKCKNI